MAQQTTLLIGTAVQSESSDVLHDVPHVNSDSITVHVVTVPQKTSDQLPDTMPNVTSRKPRYKKHENDIMCVMCIIWVGCLIIGSTLYGVARNRIQRDEDYHSTNMLWLEQRARNNVSCPTIMPAYVNCSALAYLIYDKMTDAEIAVTITIVCQSNNTNITAKCIKNGKILFDRLGNYIDTRSVDQYSDYQWTNQMELAGLVFFLTGAGVFLIQILRCMCWV